MTPCCTFLVMMHDVCRSCVRLWLVRHLLAKSAHACRSAHLPCLASLARFVADLPGDRFHTAVFVLVTMFSRLAYRTMLVRVAPLTVAFPGCWVARSLVPWQLRQPKSVHPPSRCHTVSYLCALCSLLVVLALWTCVACVGETLMCSVNVGLNSPRRAWHASPQPPLPPRNGARAARVSRQWPCPTRLRAVPNLYCLGGAACRRSVTACRL